MSRSTGDKKKVVARHSVILFADIAGSTRLYESLGNFRAREIVACVLSGMTRIVERYDGEIVKTIGDEIMCRFSSPDHAVAAAIDIQTTLQGGLFGADHPVQVRIGMHYGPVVHEDRDVYGDAVNVAARMSTIAKAGQILATQDTVRALSPPLREKTRFFDAANVKGKEQTLVFRRLGVIGTTFVALTASRSRTRIGIGIPAIVPNKPEALVVEAGMHP